MNIELLGQKVYPSAGRKCRWDFCVDSGLAGTEIFLVKSKELLYTKEAIKDSRLFVYPSRETPEDRLMTVLGKERYLCKQSRGQRASLPDLGCL